MSEESFEGFFDREVGLQVRRATLLAGSVDEANDIVQEAFVAVYERWDRIDDPGPYLNRTVLNLCRDRARRSGRLQQLLPRLLPDSVAVDRGDLLDDVLAALPFNQRAALVLRYWAGFSVDEIAAELDCPPGSVGPWIHRGLNRMRKVLL